MQKMSKMWKELHKPQEERFFRKGTIGDWENHFTPEIDEDFDKVLEVSKERIHKNLHAKEKCDGQ